MYYTYSIDCYKGQRRGHEQYHFQLLGTRIKLIGYQLDLDMMIIKSAGAVRDLVNDDLILTGGGGQRLSLSSVDIPGSVAAEAIQYYSSKLIVTKK